jgi:hypothetical protein
MIVLPPPKSAMQHALSISMMELIHANLAVSLPTPTRMTLSLQKDATMYAHHISRVVPMIVQLHALLHTSIRMI